MRILSATAISLVTALASVSSCRADNTPVHGNTEATYIRLHGPLAVESPHVPKSMKFAGQEISFDREDMFERMDRELTSMAYTHGSTLLLIKRANRYFPIIEPILKRKGVPRDLIYLACVESTLNQRAYSPAKAAGIWQFMPATAKQYGLEVNDWVDERYDIEKETEAACRYLKKAHDEYGNWESAAAAYNAGTTRITKELEAQVADTSFDLYLVDETSRYVFRILATKLILENPAMYGFNLTSDQLYKPMEYKTVEVSSPIADWPAWAQEHGINFAILREANPWIRAKSLPNKTGKTYQVKIPTNEWIQRSKSPVKVHNEAWVTDHE